MRRWLGTILLGLAVLAFSGYEQFAAAQFFWPFEPRMERERRPPTRRRAPRDDQGQPRQQRPRGDDLPPVVEPKPSDQAQRPPEPDDRPYDPKLLRLSEILGAVHYLRELCGAEEGQVWRQQMQELLKHEGKTAIRRAKLVKSFNDGYRGYRRTYRSCTDSATIAIARFVEEGAQLAQAMANIPR